MLRLSDLSPDIFAAFTGPDGGVTSIASPGRVGNGNGTMTAPDAAEDSEDFDFIDLDDFGGPKSRRHSEEEDSKGEKRKCLEFSLFKRH